MDVVDVILAKALSGGGGGGSSDFSTAEVTISFSGLPEGVSIQNYLPLILTIVDGTYWATFSNSPVEYRGYLTAILYSGSAVFSGEITCYADNNNTYVRDWDGEVILDGGIEEDGDDFVITGDCSITFPLIQD